MAVTRAFAAIGQPDAVMSMEVAPGVLIRFKATLAVEIDPFGVVLVTT